MSRKVDTALPSLAKMKIMIIGDCGVGKTALLNKYNNPSTKIVDSALKPTIGIDYISKRCDVENVPSYIHFWDLSGDELYVEVRNEFYGEANGFILAYDVSNKESFTHLQQWIEEGSKFNADWSTSILVGNKSDVSSSAVSADEAYSFAKKLNIPSFQVSAKAGKGVTEAITELLKMIQRKLG